MPETMYNDTRTDGAVKLQCDATLLSAAIAEPTHAVAAVATGTRTTEQREKAFGIVKNVFVANFVAKKCRPSRGLWQTELRQKNNSWKIQREMSATHAQHW
eukprot:scpid42284/ scgid35400/ 